MSGGARPARSRALRYGAGTSALVLVVCALVAGLSAWTLSTVGARVSSATARTVGEVTGAAERSAQVRWSAQGTTRADTLALAVPAPPVGTRTEIAYDPHQPGTVLMPGSVELAAVDRATSGVAFTGLLAAVVVVTGAWQVLSRRRLLALPARRVAARRVRVQSGLLTRSWLELESQERQGSLGSLRALPRWVPVHFDPVLTTMPAPCVLWLHGDPRPHRLVAAAVDGADGAVLYPSGPVRDAEPRGRRLDSPARPDPGAPVDSADPGPARSLQADAALLTPAPVVGLLWVFLDGGGLPTWGAATALTAALALWWAALRGSDPT